MYFGAVIGSYVAGVMFATCGYIAVFMAATGLILGENTRPTSGLTIFIDNFYSQLAQFMLTGSWSPS